MNNPLQRRYQVFVSSTYGDLIEERKHVIQALLESKCIPAGMELFPAASQDQWSLIRHVIDDCDYYVVIVAGKYGSIGPDGRSFTEMEFDYAVESGKPVLGFFYDDLDTLPGAKLERSEERRAKLLAFTKKVQQRLCRPWRSAEGLGSAIKSAMLNEIEFNPRPGWIRADAAPDPDLIVKLKQRILELEQKVSRNGEEKFASGDDLLEIQIDYRYPPSPASKEPVWRWPTHPFGFQTTWDKVFRVLAPRLTQPKTRRALKMILQHWIGAESRRLRAGSSAVPLLVEPNVERDQFDRILQTYLARGLMKRTPPPVRVRTKDPYWQITPKGTKRLAELEAIPAFSSSKSESNQGKFYPQ